MRHIGRRVLLSTVLLSLFAVGCGDDMNEPNSELDYTPTVKSVDEAKQEARELSSRILDITGIRGRVSEPGPGVSICEADPERDRLYIIRHSWSVHEPPHQTLQEGMDRLRQQLPENAWRIVEEGELNNADRTPRILFENDDVEYAANVELPGGTEEFEPMLTVDLVSACFSTPKGESPRGEY